MSKSTAQIACLGATVPAGPTGPAPLSAKTTDAAGATAGIVNHLTDRYTMLKKSCWELCDAYNLPVIDDGRVWASIEKIEKLINYK